MHFLDRLHQSIRATRSHLCVGLDPDLQKLPEALPRDAEGVKRFLLDIIEATADFACCYKPNLAFFGSLGIGGLTALQDVIGKASAIHPVILDAKFGDIGNTAEHFARMAFDWLKADAVTLNPYLGMDSLAPFLKRQEAYAFILGVTSNPGAADIQQRPMPEGRRVFEELAALLEGRFPEPNWGWVAGATQLEPMEALRAASPKRWFLIPGVGAQGGELGKALQASRSPEGTTLALVNASRSILYASPGADYQTAAAQAAEAMVKEMRFSTGSLEGGITTNV